MNGSTVIRYIICHCEQGPNPDSISKLAAKPVLLTLDALASIFCEQSRRRAKGSQAILGAKTQQET
jgi:hypothetical protein